MTAYSLMVALSSCSSCRVVDDTIRSASVSARVRDRSYEIQPKETPVRPESIPFPQWMSKSPTLLNASPGGRARNGCGCLGTRIGRAANRGAPRPSVFNFVDHGNGLDGDIDKHVDEIPGQVSAAAPRLGTDRGSDAMEFGSSPGNPRAVNLNERV